MPDSTIFPPITIIMPCYNSVETLSAALEAIIALDYPEFELIVVDDCSTDESCSIIIEYTKQHSFIRFFRLERNSGVQAARDFATRQAHHQWIASTDSDAVVPNDWLQKASSYFASADMIGGSFIVTPRSMIERSLNLMSLSKQHDPTLYRPDSTWFDPNVAGNNFFYRRTMFDAIGGYAKDVRAAEEALLVARGLAHGFSYFFVPELTVSHPFTPRCLTLNEFVRRFWQLHKWRKVAGKKSVLIRNRNNLIVAGGLAIFGFLAGSIFWGGVVYGTVCILLTVAITLAIQAVLVKVRSGERFLLCLLGALLKLVRRIVGCLAILLPGAPTPAGWSKRS